MYDRSRLPAGCTCCGERNAVSDGVDLTRRPYLGYLPHWDATRLNEELRAKYAVAVPTTLKAGRAQLDQGRVQGQAQLQVRPRMTHRGTIEGLKEVPKR
jgi:hypothetical protein